MPAFAVLHTTHLFTVTRCRRRIITPPLHLIHTQSTIYGIFSCEAVQEYETSLWFNQSQLFFVRYMHDITETTAGSMVKQRK